jgi:hypothetical protein
MIVNENRRWAGDLTLSGIWKSLIPVYQATMTAINGRKNQIRISVPNLYTAKTGELTAGQAASAGASEIIVSGNVGVIHPGMYFSHDDFLYIAEGYDTKLRFNPPLRQAIPAGDSLEFMNPVIRCRLANDDSGKLIVSHHRWAEDPQLSLVEAFDR